MSSNIEKTNDYVKSLLSAMGFEPIVGKLEVLSKTYTFGNKSYIIEVDLPQKAINYPQEIRRGRNTTVNFSDAENFVVLECVNRLLDIGYTPEHLYLEAPAAHGGKFLDILIFDESSSNQSTSGQYAIVECKTYGTKFKAALKELTNPNKPDPQLMEYGHQFRSVKILCLYSSQYNSSSNNIDKEVSIISFTDEMRSATNVVEVKEAWSGIYSPFGLFDQKPYQKTAAKRTYANLLEIEENAGRQLYNDFAKILRKYVVSDKSNAYNKLFNLFLCKIVDEEMSNNPTNPILKFQVDESESDIDFMKKLYLLYKVGMKKYLSKDVVDYSDEELAKYGPLNPEVKQMIDEIRMYKNGEFSFIDVLGKESFKANCSIVKEVVRLLQDFKLMYTHKHPYLGLFFENLLNSGFKQESGQYFTSIPVAHFIVSSIPFKEYICKKINNGESNFLPYTIDYACGSGHFLTEGMDEIQKTIKDILENIPSITATQHKRLEAFVADEYSWAKEYIYGIDFDYRLVKTTKVSTFLNGDGEANIIHSNGLAPFNSKEYTDKLHSDSIVNENFDILLANPPYSVQNFKQTIFRGKERFILYPHLGEDSDDIECLFVERIGQLIKEGGYIGVILPTSILESQKVFSKTREYIINNFRIVGIVRLSDQAFMKTGTKTAVLFLEKREPAQKDNLLKSISNYVSKKANGDFSYESLPRVLETFAKNALGLNDISELSALIDSKNEELFSQMIYTFAVTYTQRVVVADAGVKDAAKAFLGFDYTERRGKEGIQEKYDGNDDRKIDSKLFSPDGLKSDKVNYYIYKNFLNEDISSIHKSLEKNLFVNRLSELIPFEIDKGKVFNRFIYTNLPEMNHLLDIKSRYPVKPLREILPNSIRKGSSITKDKTTPGAYSVVAGGKSPAYTHNDFNRKAGVLTVSASGANAGFVNYYDKPIFASDCLTIESDNKILLKYVFYVLKARQKDIYVFAKGNGQPHMYDISMYKMRIPDPNDSSVMEEIIRECDKVFYLTDIKEKIRDEKIKKIVDDKLEIKYNKQ